MIKLNIIHLVVLKDLISKISLTCVKLTSWWKHQKRVESCQKHVFETQNFELQLIVMMKETLQQCDVVIANWKKKEAKKIAKTNNELSEFAKSSFVDFAISTSRNHDHESIWDENIKAISSRLMHNRYDIQHLFLKKSILMLSHELKDWTSKSRRQNYTKLSWIKIKHSKIILASLFLWIQYAENIDLTTINICYFIDCYNEIASVFTFYFLHLISHFSTHTLMF